MEKNVKEVIGDNEYKKYLLIAKEGGILLVTANSKVGALNIIAKNMKHEYLEKTDFELCRIDLEITESGELIRYSPEEDQE